MRGERKVPPVDVIPASGSSPHARGTPSWRRSASGRSRFIPACAGNAIWLVMPPPLPPVHPRMRGERTQIAAAEYAETGSSPHARGTPRTAAANRARWRFIPACAGNARHPASIRSWTTVHPRMRGERCGSRMKVKRTAGSSPHARGTRREGRGCSHECRFIPACAGNA